MGQTLSARMTLRDLARIQRYRQAWLRGDRETATARLREGREIAQTMGLVRLIARADVALDEIVSTPLGERPAERGDGSQAA